MSGRPCDLNVVSWMKALIAAVAWFMCGAGSISLPPSGGATLAPLTTYTATIAGVRSLESGVALAAPPRVAVHRRHGQRHNDADGDAHRAANGYRWSESGDVEHPGQCLNQRRLQRGYFPGRGDCGCPQGQLCRALCLARRQCAGRQSLALAARWSLCVELHGNSACCGGKCGGAVTNPASAAVGVCPGASINATFAAPSGFAIDAETVNAANFVLTVPLPVAKPVPAASVVVDVATGRIATFTPATAFVTGATYTATIKRGVKDLALPAGQRHQLELHRWPRQWGLSGTGRTWCCTRFRLVRGH